MSDQHEAQQKEKELIFSVIKGNRKNKCEICGKFFKEKGNLVTHRKIHSGERPYKCDFASCRKSFITLGNLKAHLDHHLGKKPFLCDFEGCNQRYSRQNRLEIHMRTHSGNRPYKCPFGDCDKSFNEKGNLKTHYRIHTGERPFLCHYSGCTKSFKAHSHLKDHEKTHSRLKPYKCKICHKSYGRSGILKTHLKTHNLNPEEIGIMASKVQENILTPGEESEGRVVINSKLSLQNMNIANHLNLATMRNADDSITVSYSSNPNEDMTPVTIEKLKTLASTHIKSQNKNEHAPIQVTQKEPKLSLSLLKVPKLEHNNKPTAQSNVELNFITPKNLSNVDETPNSKTPLSRVESSIKNYLSSGQDNINLEEASTLYNIYASYLNKYLQLYSNEVKYANFSRLFQEYLFSSAVNNQKLSLQTLMQILDTQNKNKSILNNAENGAIKSSLNTNQQNILNNIRQQDGNQNSSPMSFSNLQMLNKNKNNQAYNFSSFHNMVAQSTINQNNLHMPYYNPSLIVENSPFLAYSALSPLFNSNLMNNNNIFDTARNNINSNTKGNSNNNQNTIPPEFTFSDYMKLFQYKN